MSAKELSNTCVGVVFCLIGVFGRPGKNDIINLTRAVNHPLGFCLGNARLAAARFEETLRRYRLW